MKFGFTRREIKPVTKEQDEAFKSQLENLGFKDKLAMVLGAFISIVLPCLLVLGGLSLLAMFVFGAFN